MSNVTINTLPTALTIDGALDILPIYTASSAATQGISRNVLLGLSSAPVGLTDQQTLTSKILTGPTISGPTLSGTLSGTYTIGGTPTFPSSVVQLTASQTLTNKVLTSPTINSPTITNATISADTLSGFTTSTNGTVYGMSVAGGILASAALVGAVNTAALAAQSVTPAKLNLAPTVGNQTTSGTTTSTTYTSTLTGSSAATATVTVGSNGLLLVGIYYFNVTNSGANYCNMSFALSGANTQAAADILSIAMNGTLNDARGATFLLTGLSPGSTTITANFHVSAGTGTFGVHRVWGLPL